MNSKNNRYLKSKFPLLENNGNLPVGYNYTQLYSGIILDDNDKPIPYKSAEKISVSKYQVPQTSLYPVFHKPISKFLVIADD